VEGLVRALAHLEGILRKRSRQARRDPDHFQRKVQAPVVQGDAPRRQRAASTQPAVEDEEITEVRS